MFTFVAGYVAGQRSAARASAYASSAASNTIIQTGAEIDQVNERIDRLLVVVDAMWWLLKESGWTDEQLRQRIAEIDGADGMMDGRRTAKPRPCPKCDAMVTPDRTSCAFCGTEMAAGPGATGPGVLDAI